MPVGEAPGQSRDDAMRFLPIMKALPIVGLLLLAPQGCERSGQAPEEATAGGAETGYERPEEPPTAADLAIEELEATYESLEGPQEKAELLESYLEEFPDTEHTPGVVRELARLLTRELDRPEMAQAAITEALAAASDNDQRRYLEMELAIHFAGTGQMEALRELTAEMAREYDFKFTDHYQLMEAATEAEAWELVVEQAGAALAYATPAAYKAQYPDMTEAEAERNGRRRVAYARAFEGWALANLGRADEALALFEAALPNAAYSLLGADETPLHLYWGMSLLESGDAEGALEKLSVEAIHGLHQEGAGVFREAWIAARGGEEGLEEYLWEVRLERSMELPDFALAGYDDAIVDTAELGGRVILVAAWHPT